MESIKTKKCAHCLRDRPVSEYGLWRSSPDGYRTYCEKCNSWIVRSRYRKKHGIIKPRKNDDFNYLIPGVNPQNKAVIDKAIKNPHYSGLAIHIPTREVFRFSVHQTSDSFCVFSLLRGDKGMSLNFNRFLEAPKLDLTKMLYRNEIRLEESQDSMDLAKALLFDV